MKTNNSKTENRKHGFQTINIAYLILIISTFLTLISTIFLLALNSEEVLIHSAKESGLLGKLSNYVYEDVKYEFYNSEVAKAQDIQEISKVFELYASERIIENEVKNYIYENIQYIRGKRTNIYAFSMEENIINMLEHLQSNKEDINVLKLGSEVPQFLDIKNYVTMNFVEAIKDVRVIVFGILKVSLLIVLLYVFYYKFILKKRYDSSFKNSIRAVFIGFLSAFILGIGLRFAVNTWGANGYIFINNNLFSIEALFLSKVAQKIIMQLVVYSFLLCMVCEITIYIYSLILSFANQSNVVVPMRKKVPVMGKTINYIKNCDVLKMSEQEHNSNKDSIPAKFADEQDNIA